MPDVPYEVYLEISRKKAHYGRFLDTKQWDQFQHIARPDARFHFYDTNNEIITRNGKPYDFTSLAAFVDWFSIFFGKAQTLHMFGPPDMSMQSANEISVIWSMEDQIYFQAESKLAEIRGGGYYHETWVRENDSWWLKDLALRRTYQKVSSPP